MAWITAGDIRGFMGMDTATPAEMAHFALLATAAQEAIERWCKRHFEAADYIEWFDGTGTDSLLLPESPIIRVNRISMSAYNCIQIINTSTDAVTATVASHGGNLFLIVQAGVNAGIQTLTLSTYATMTLLLAAIVALLKGWSGSVIAEGTPSEIRPQTYPEALNNYVTLEMPGDMTEYIFTEQESGILVRAGGWGRGTRSIFISYRAGYVTVPENLKLIALRVASDLYDASKRDTGLITERTTGGYTWTARSEPSLMKIYEGDLAPYRRLCTGK